MAMAFSKLKTSNHFFPLRTYFFFLSREIPIQSLNHEWWITFNHENGWRLDKMCMKFSFFSPSHGHKHVQYFEILCYLSAFNIFSDLIKLRSNHPYVVLAYKFGSIFRFAVYLLVIVLLSQRTNERPNECRSWSMAFACKFFRSMFINFHYKNQIEWSISLHYMHVITVLFEIPIVRQHLGIQIGCYTSRKKMIRRVGPRLSTFGTENHTKPIPFSDVSAQLKHISCYAKPFQSQCDWNITQRSQTSCQVVTLSIFK